MKRITNRIIIIIILLILLFAPIITTKLIHLIKENQNFGDQIIGTFDGWITFYTAFLVFLAIVFDKHLTKLNEERKIRDNLKIIFKYFVEKNSKEEKVFDFQRDLTLSYFVSKERVFDELSESFIKDNFSDILNYKNGKEILQLNQRMVNLEKKREKYIQLTNKLEITWDSDRKPIKSRLNRGNEYLNEEVKKIVTLSEAILYFLNDQKKGFEIKLEELKGIVFLKETFNEIPLLESYKEMVTMYDKWQLDDEVPSTKGEEVDLEALEYDSSKNVILLNQKTIELYKRVKKDLNKKDITDLYNILIDFYEKEKKEIDDLKKITEILVRNDKSKLETTNILLDFYSQLLAEYYKKSYHVSYKNQNLSTIDKDLPLNLSILTKSINNEVNSIYDELNKIKLLLE